MAKRPDPIRSAAAKRGWQTRRIHRELETPCCQPQPRILLCKNHTESLFTVNKPNSLQPTIKVGENELLVAVGWIAASAITTGLLLWKKYKESQS